MKAGSLAWIAPTVDPKLNGESEAVVDTELMEEFLSESREHLESVEDDVLALERGEADSETVNRLFRALHTVKGAASFMSLRDITSLSHALEEIVGKLRAGTLSPSEAIVDALLRGIDQLKLLLDDPGGDRVVVEVEIDALTSVLKGRPLMSALPAAPPRQKAHAETRTKGSVVPSAPRTPAPSSRPAAASTPAEPELMDDFLSECREQLASIEGDLPTLERGEADNETVNRLFRAVHTIKGAAGFMDLGDVKSLSQALEEVLSRLRAGTVTVHEGLTRALLHGIGQLTALIDDPADGGVAIEAEVDALEVHLQGRSLTSIGPAVASSEEDAAVTDGAVPPVAPMPALVPPAPPSRPKPTRLPPVDPELLEDFLSESRDHLVSVEDDVLALERGEADTETVNRLFRALHTVKGAASFMALGEITILSHALEDVVGRLRAGTLTPNEAIVDALLRGIDQLKLLLDDPEGGLVDVDVEVEALDATLKGRPVAPPTSAFVKVAPTTTPQPVPAPRAVPRASVVPPPSTPKPTPPVARLSKKSTPPSSSLQSTRSPGVAAPPRAAEADHTVRIPVVLLDKLMNLASELVLVRNQNVQAVGRGDMEQMTAIAQRLNVVTSEIQTTIMQTRMRPVRPVFNRFVRVVRDLAKKLGKEAELSIVGADVELDKNIIEAIGDPLTHLIRNAADHGIEAPDVRRVAGKSAKGKIELAALQQAGQVVIQIRDDGRGMDPDAIKATAFARGLIDAEQAEVMDSREAFNLIFLPGVSTAQSVTDVSGRGVGMDAVKDSFKRLGGVVELSSEAGVGTTVTIKLPLTLAIVPALVVDVEDLRFAIPQVNIDEVVLLHGETMFQDLKVVDDQEVYWLRGKLLPVLRLSRLLNIPLTYFDNDEYERFRDRRMQRPDRRQGEDEEGVERRGGLSDRRTSRTNSANIVVLTFGDEQFGLLVDTIIDTEEIVVKSLHDQLKACSAYAGTTVLGDGRIAMILDVPALVEMGGLSFTNVERSLMSKTSSGAARSAVLLFNLGGDEIFSVPLALITRVEEIRPGDIQVAEGREFLAYRGAAMPLVRVERSLSGFGARYDAPLYVIIPRAGKNVGVLASAIMDTVEIGADIDGETLATDGIYGSLLVEDRIVLLLDIYEVVERTLPDFLSERDRHAGPRKRVLFVEDSALHASLIKPTLEAAGFEVVLAQHGARGLELARSSTFDLIVSDLEMPVMDGFEMARTLRQDKAVGDIPMLAVSASDDAMLEERALEAGFDEFRSKLDQSALAARIRGLADEVARRRGRG